MTDKFYENYHFSPDYVRDNPIMISIVSLDKKFTALTHESLVRGSVKLTQTLCSEDYFLWGGFNASRLVFECLSDNFTDEPPAGKIQLTITPTVYTDGQLTEILTAEETSLFTGYIETAEPDNIQGHWSVAAYDRLYRVRNNEIVEWLANTLKAASASGKYFTWREMIHQIGVQLGLLIYHDEDLPAIADSTFFPDNNDIATENGVDMLRDFALCLQRFGMIDGEGNLRFVEVQDSATGAECYRVNQYCPDDFSVSSGHVWLPKYFTSEPRTNIFYSTGQTTSEEDYFNNYYVIQNNPCIGDQNWINERYECDEYGTQSSKYSAANMPAGLFDTSKMCLTNGEEFCCQEYKMKILADPTIPMGSIIHVVKNGVLAVKSYIMERTIAFSSTQTIECEMSAHNAPYNAVVSELDYGVRSANALANETSAKMPFISDGSNLTKLRAHKVLSKSDYSALKEKRADTIYYVYDDSTS